MALGDYKDVYTLVEYKNRVKDISSTIDSINVSFIDEGFNKVKNQIKTLKQKERKIF